ncbi:hypothetical protein SHJG_8738 [Streptomyces hygroscopicus subsp. jinggangensis 5008]|nr:hypothetical protein SHJG_8738 [Streptomyces hygroscopicus subsp. jinggangensis 5008]AGF68157.1 hypothetical protein SHJGH_8495 [Streptomyces hygroscopicus subsp. jinggangensis TL01]
MREELQAARRELDQSTVLGRAAAHQASPETAALPAAPALHPVPVTPKESPADSLAHLILGAEQLTRIAFEAAHSSAERRMSGSDLPKLARWLAMTRLITARLLEHATTGEHAQDRLVAGLAASARDWHTAAQAWHHIVDLPPPSAGR